MHRMKYSSVWITHHLIMWIQDEQDLNNQIQAGFIRETMFLDNSSWVRSSELMLKLCVLMPSWTPRTLYAEAWLHNLDHPDHTDFVSIFKIKSEQWFPFITNPSLPWKNLSIYGALMMSSIAVTAKGGKQDCSPLVLTAFQNRALAMAGGCTQANPSSTQLGSLENLCRIAGWVPECQPHFRFTGSGCLVSRWPYC